MSYAPLESPAELPSPATPAATSSALAILEGARAELDRARDAVLTLGTEHEAARRQRDAARAQIEQLEAQVMGLQSQRDQLQGQVAALQTRQDHLEAQRDQLQTRADGFEAQHAGLEAQRAASAAHAEQLDAENAQLRAARDASNARCDALHQDLSCERERNRTMQDEIANLHLDLFAEDLPMLALKMAMRLTGAEVGLFTEADGDGTLARIGFDGLQDFLVQAIFDFSRRAAATEQPSVENEPERLPDGAGLVNLAALPFAVKGKMSGILLLANKREAGFSEDECRLLVAIGQHAGLAMENSRLHRQLGESYASTVAVLADAIEAKDAYTRGHCEGVSRVAVEVARRLGLSGGALDEVRYAALLHDVGKIGVPDGILLKPSRLMPEEFSIIQKHAAIGRDLVSRVPALSHLGDVILHHHERFDGSGYPDGLSGEGIPLVSRIIGIVDAFDAMTTPRPYRDAVDAIEAFAEIRRCSGSQFDPEIVKIVTQVLMDERADATTPPIP